MSLSLEQVEHIAYLARLELTEAEKLQFRQQLSAILDYVASLQELDTVGIPTASGVQPPQLRLREDRVEPGLNRADLFANSPDTIEDQFRIPPIFE